MAGRQITSTRQVDIGDGVMVHKIYMPRDGDKPRTWKLLGVVIGLSHKTSTVEVIRVGATLDDDPVRVYLDYHGRNHVWLLADHEQPGPLIALRTQLVLTGQIEI